MLNVLTSINLIFVSAWVIAADEQCKQRVARKINQAAIVDFITIRRVDQRCNRIMASFFCDRYSAYLDVAPAMIDEQEQQWREEAERIKLLPRAMQRKLLDLHRLTASNKKLSAEELREARRHVKALEKLLKLPKPKKA